MSADNYEAIWKDPGGGYRVTCEFASDDGPWELMRDGRLRGAWFATLEEAEAFAHHEYSEYGVTHMFETKTLDVT